MSLPGRKRKGGAMYSRRRRPQDRLLSTGGAHVGGGFGSERAMGTVPQQAGRRGLCGELQLR